MNEAASHTDSPADVLRASRYARQLIASGSCTWDPEALARPFGREEMRQWLVRLPPDEAALDPGLR